MFSEIFYLGTQGIVTLILVYNTLGVNSLGAWLGISAPLYNISMAKRTLNFQKYLELNPVVFINMLGGYTSNISIDSYHSRIGTLAFAQFHWVSRKNLSRLPETCHPFYCLSPLHKKGSRFSSGRSRSHYKQYTQVHCSLKPFQRSILQVRNALTSNVKRMCCAKNIQSSIWKAHPQREANQQSLFGKDTLLSKDEKQCISMNPKLMWMRNITVAKNKATVFGTKRKGTPQILPPKSKKASHIHNLQTTGLHVFCLHNLLSATTFSSAGINPQYPVWLAGCGQVNIFQNLFDYTNIFIHTTQQWP